MNNTVKEKDKAVDQNDLLCGACEGMGMMYDPFGNAVDCYYCGGSGVY